MANLDALTYDGKIYVRVTDIQMLLLEGAIKTKDDATYSEALMDVYDKLKEWKGGLKFK